MKCSSENPWAPAKIDGASTLSMIFDLTTIHRLQSVLGCTWRQCWQGVEEEAGGVRAVASASDAAIEELVESREGMDI